MSKWDFIRNLGPFLGVLVMKIGELGPFLGGPCNADHNVLGLIWGGSVHENTK